MSLTRRGFLKATLGGVALASFAPFVPEGLAGSLSGMVAEKGSPDRILVIVQLTGGNDGLNTVVPYADDAYAKNRTTLHLPTNELHRIDSYLGFHPRMAAFNRLYKEGHLSILQGVGTANPSGDHDVAMRMWHSGEPDRLNCQTGWIGRTADIFRDGNETQVAAAFVGPIAAPFALRAQGTFLPSVRTPRDLMI
ncbi:MAG: twin-arginine translocation signal domain-containing protein, partial [Sedimentisphaerales bacterium]|nr:twin-arginine translocation signal domain-containing protein [Sedimentisphaerales bacterium]